MYTYEIKDIHYEYCGKQDTRNKIDESGKKSFHTVIPIIYYNNIRYIENHEYSFLSAYPFHTIPIFMI